jgi:hypothetical protein
VSPAVNERHDEMQPDDTGEHEIRYMRSHISETSESLDS